MSPKDDSGQTKVRLTYERARKMALQAEPYKSLTLRFRPIRCVVCGESVSDVRYTHSGAKYPGENQRYTISGQWLSGIGPTHRSYTPETLGVGLTIPYCKKHSADREKAQNVSIIAPMLALLITAAATALGEVIWDLPWIDFSDDASILFQLFSAAAVMLPALGLALILNSATRKVMGIETTSAAISVSKPNEGTLVFSFRDQSIAEEFAKNNGLK